jgi:hypothetical protein
MASAVKREARAAVNHGAKAVRAVPDDTRAFASDLVHDMRDQASECIQSSRDRLAQLQNRFADSIRQDPIRNVLLAIGAGCLLGLWLRRR